MIWKVEWDEPPLKSFRKLDLQIQSVILSYLRKRIATEVDPRRFGKDHTAEYKGLWRYSVADYRILCSIADEVVTVVVVAVGHRRDIYR